MDVEYEIAELKRRMDNMIRVCTVIDTNYTAVPPLVKVADGEVELGWIPFMALRAGGGEVSWDALEVGERVTVLALSGDMVNARVLPGALYCTDNSAPTTNSNLITRIHSDGAHDTYNRDLHIRMLEVPEAGEIRLTVGGASLALTKDEALITAPKVTFTSPRIVLDGEVHLGGLGGKPVARKDDTINTTTKLITKGSSNVFSK